MGDLRDQLAASLSGTYSLDHELGGGGMSRVFLAEETALGRKVVIKLLSPELAEGLSAGRFVREIRVAARLQQANIVPVLQAGEVDGLPYYTMPFVAGESLRARLARGSIATKDALAILRDVAKALAFAHHEGIVHRDIKPENILISGGTAVVTDFGIAKAISASRHSEHGMTALTVAGTSVGTPAYMAPEQAAGDPATDVRTDLYSWGVLAYELLAGRHPFADRATASDLVRAHMTAVPEPLAASTAPEAVRAVIMQCLAKSPAERPSSAADVISAFDTVPLPPRRPIGAWSAMAIYAGIFAGVVVLAKVAITSVGLPTWVFGGSAGVMLLGLPVILLTALVERQRGGASTGVGSSIIAGFATRHPGQLTWRTTRRGGAAAFAIFALAVGAYMAMRQFGIGPFASLIASNAIAANDRVLIADFRGPASDTSLGAVFAEGMRAALDESRVVRLIPPDRAGEILQQMRTPGAAIVGPVAREVAERSGAKVVVDGDVKTIGKAYALTARLLAPSGGEPLITLQETARDDADFTSAVGRLAKRLRERIGESLRSVNSAPELASVTTASLPALRKYTAAQRAIGRFDYAGGLQLFRDAVAIDTGFAMAYSNIGSVLSILAVGQRQLAVDNLQKAFDTRDRATPADRARIELEYWSEGPTVDAQQEAAALSRLAEIDSTRYAPTLTQAALDVGQPARSLWFSRMRLKNDSTDVGAYRPMITAFGALGQMDSVRYYVNRARERNPRNPLILSFVADLASHDGDDSTALATARDIERRNAPVLIEIGAAHQSMILLRDGHVRESIQAYEHSLESQRRRGATGTQRTALTGQALIQAGMFGDSAHAVALLDSALRVDPWESSAPRDRNYFLYALAASESHRLDLVKQALERLRRDDPGQPLYLGGPAMPLLEGLELRGEGNFAAAIASFRRGDMPQRSLYPTALVATTFDMAGQKDSAMVYYEKLLNSTQLIAWMMTDSRYGQTARRRLGELYEERGEFDKAYDRYAEFVRLWKTADPELQPAVATVRARMARLESRRAR